MGTMVVTPPTELPVTVPTVKLHLRVDHGEEDTYLSGLIEAATQQAETFLRRQLVTATLACHLDRFPSASQGIAIDLPSPPLQSVTSVQYLDTAGVLQTLDAAEYLVDTKGTPGRILPAYGKSWPAVRCQANAVTVTYVAGYGNSEDVPHGIVQAILFLVGHWYHDREGAQAVPSAFEHLLWSFRNLRMA